jgi:hypothetical protein
LRTAVRQADLSAWAVLSAWKRGTIRDADRRGGSRETPLCIYER